MTNLKKQIEALSQSDIDSSFRGKSSPGEILYSITANDLLPYNKEYLELIESENEEAANQLFSEAYRLVEERFGQAAKELFQ